MKTEHVHHSTNHPASKLGIEWKKITSSIIINTHNALAYRLNFFIEEVRYIITLLTIFLFWSALYQHNTNLFGYSKSAIMAYLVGTAFLGNLIAASNANQAAGLIRNGNLSRYLLWPMSLFTFMFSLDIADKGIHILLAVIELAAIIAIFRFPFYIPYHILTYFLCAIMVILTIFLSFFLNFIVSLTAFWTEDPWSTRWLFSVVFLSFLSGSYFPLNILPGSVVNILNFTPFPYLFYYPVRIWLEKTTLSQSLYIIGICFSWTVLLYVIAKIWFHVGTKNFGAYGG